MGKDWTCCINCKTVFNWTNDEYFRCCEKCNGDICGYYCKDTNCIKCEKQEIKKECIMNCSICESPDIETQCDCGFKVCEDCCYYGGLKFFDNSRGEPIFDKIYTKQCCLYCIIIRRKFREEILYSIRHMWYYLPDKPIKHIRLSDQ
jgi:hypothetical protein